MKRKLLLVNGCSHAAGHEIDGTLDSAYNRQHSFGNLLSKKLERSPINIAVGGANNSLISRSTIEWIESNFNPTTDDLLVLISWTESSRVEAPIDWINGYYPTHSDWKSESLKDFIRINQGSDGCTKEEKELIDYWKNFIVMQQKWLELDSLTQVLQCQYYLKSKNIHYLMCNAGYLYTLDKHTKWYHDLIDHACFVNAASFQESFYQKYKTLGFNNTKAKYWHHDEVPHIEYSNLLFNFIS